MLEVLKVEDITVLQWKGLAEFAIKTKMEALGLIEEKRPLRSKEHNTKFLQQILDEARNRKITSPIIKIRLNETWRRQLYIMLLQILHELS